MSAGRSQVALEVVAEILLTAEKILCVATYAVLRSLGTVDRMLHIDYAHRGSAYHQACDVLAAAVVRRFHRDTHAGHHLGVAGVFPRNASAADYLSARLRCNVTVAVALSRYLSGTLAVGAVPRMPFLRSCIRCRVSRRSACF